MPYPLNYIAPVPRVLWVQYSNITPTIRVLTSLPHYGPWFFSAILPSLHTQFYKSVFRFCCFGIFYFFIMSIIVHREIILFLALSFWLTSFNMILSSFIHKLYDFYLSLFWVISLYIHTHHGFFIQLTVLNTWVVSKFCILWVGMQWISSCLF